MNAITDAAQKMQKTTTEEIQVAGNELMTRVKGLIAEGRVRHIKVKSPNGETYFEVPLAVGVLGGAALAWASPFIAMAGALAGMVTSLKVEVVRDADAVDAMQAVESGAKAAADKAWEAATAAKKTATNAVKGAVSTVKKAAGKAPARAAAAAKKAPAKVAKAAKPAAKKVAKKAVSTVKKAANKKAR